MEASTVQDPVAEARAAQKAAQTTLTEARNELKKSKTALAKAQADEKGKEGDEAKAAAKATKEASAAVDSATKVVAQAEKDVATAKENTVKIRDAEKQRKAEERANRPKKAPLTLSQRRALLRLGDGPQVPSTEFNKLPYEHLVAVGLAETKTVKADGPVIKETVGEGDDKKVVEKPGPKVDATQYSLTDTGKERVAEINPKWKDWKPAATEQAATA